MPSGRMLSLRMSFTRSAIGWRSPNGPTRFGPSRTWKRPSSRRSSQVRNAKTSITRFASTNAFTNVRMKPSGIPGLRLGRRHRARAEVRPARGDPDDAGTEPPQDDRGALVLAALVRDAQPVAGLDAERLRVIVRELDARPPLEVKRRAMVDGRPRHELAIADDDRPGRRLRR